MSAPIWGQGMRGACAGGRPGLKPRADSASLSEANAGWWVVRCQGRDTEVIDGDRN